MPYGQDKLEQFMAQTEKGVATDEHDELINNVTIKLTVNAVEDLLTAMNRKRAILLLDDAALSLTPDYLVEFFEVFRSVKTRLVSPKASVYPGTTEYGPSFHLGQDAQEVNAWVFVEDDSYSEFIDSLVKKRLSITEIDVPPDIVELLKYASFGVPRAFINLIRSYTMASGRTTQQKFNRVIEGQARFIQNEYMSLIRKMPQYRAIIKTGYELFKKIVSAIAGENKSTKITGKKK